MKKLVAILAKCQNLKVLACLIAVAALSSLASAEVEDLDRGHRLLLEYGLQIQGLANGDPYINEAQWLESNFTTHHFVSAHWTASRSDSPFRPWARWATPDPDDIDYDTTYWVTASHFDELELTPENIQFHATWLQGMRDRFPQIISHTTQAGRVLDLQLQDYMAAGQPDLLFFDSYEFTSSHRWDGGSPTRLYDAMGLYRTAGLAGNDGSGTRPIPVGQWIQTYRPGGTDGNPVLGYLLSESELAVQYFASWAYGYKAIAAFTYVTHVGGESVASALFDGPYDNNPTPLFYSAKKLNRQSLNLAPALLRLLNTDVYFVRGWHKVDKEWWQIWLPDEEKNDLPDYVSEWSGGAIPYISDITATNVGSMNDGYQGDVVVGRFKPLDEDFDGPDFEDEIYFMITNGLTDSDGSSLETEQMIRIDFDFGDSGITQLQRLDRDSGGVMDVALELDGGSQYHLEWSLLGGEGDLFKYDTGAPFGDCSPPCQAPPFVWNRDVTGPWELTTNWGGKRPPDSNTSTVTFGSAITTPRTAFLDSNRTVKSITFDNTNKYAITGTGSLTLEADTGNAAIDVVQGDHEIQVQVTLSSDTDVTVTSGSLDFNHQIDLGGNTLSISGNANINHSAVGGGAVVSSGSLGTSRSSTIAGNLTSTGSLVIDLGAGETDVFHVAGSAVLSGVLDVVVEPEFEPIGSYTVLTAAGGLNADGLSLDASDAANFTLGVVGNNLVLSVPEPSCLILAVLGVFYTTWRAGTLAQ